MKINQILSLDDIEYIILLSNKQYEFNYLSSGKLVYIPEPLVSPKEMGNAMKSILERMES